MRKEYTKTSPDHLYPDLNLNSNHNHRSPYLSPKNNQPSFTSFHSPSYPDPFQQKYPTSHKYNSPPQEYARSPQQPIRSPQPHRSPQQTQAIQISQLRLTINQLKTSLQSCSENSERVQQELMAQRRKNLQLCQLKRRMEEELRRMEFELERLGNYEQLEGREASIKLENALRENTRLNVQVGDLVEEVKSLKSEQRKVVSECNALLREKEGLIRDRDGLLQENESLLDKLSLLERDVKAVKREVALSQNNLPLQTDISIPSRLNNMQTVRTYQASTSNHSARIIPSHHSIELEELAQEVDYEEENKKLLDDYNKLLEENESIKQLYNNFYKEEKNPQPQPLTFQQPHSFSNHKITQILNSSRNEGPPNSEGQLMLATMQRDQVRRGVEDVREAGIGELLGVYKRTVDQSKEERKNCLKLFIHELAKKKQVYSQMAQNYLEMRMAVEEEAGLRLPEKIDNLEGKDEKEKALLAIFRSVKEKAKSEKEVGGYLAIFRLLTLLIKTPNPNPSICDNIKHSILKYAYKLNMHP